MPFRFLTMDTLMMLEVADYYLDYSLEELSDAEPVSFPSVCTATHCRTIHIQCIHT